MTISDDTVWKIVLLLAGVVFGKLWQHEGKLNKRVTYEHCTKNREHCPCIRELEDLKRRMDN